MYDENVIIGNKIYKINQQKRRNDNYRYYRNNNNNQKIIFILDIILEYIQKNNKLFLYYTIKQMI